MAPRKKSSPRELPKRAMAKRKEKEVPAKSSLERRKETVGAFGLGHCAVIATAGISAGKVPRYTQLGGRDRADRSC
jgi:hypothetical protein